MRDASSLQHRARHVPVPPAPAARRAAAASSPARPSPAPLPPAAGRPGEDPGRRRSVPATGRGAAAAQPRQAAHALLHRRHPPRRRRRPRGRRQVCVALARPGIYASLVY